MKVAAIDIGSNAVRILIAEVENNKITQTYYKKRHITKLAEVLNSKGILSQAAIDRTMEALTDFVMVINIFHPKRVHAVATSAVREAKNGQELIDKAAEMGLKIEIIDGDTEAGLIYDGIRAGVSSEGKKTLMFDIGGGSTEFIYSTPNTKPTGISIPMGVVKIAEMYNFSDTLDMEHMDRIRIPIFDLINTVLVSLRCDPQMLIGSAGTPTTLAAIDMEMTDYDQDRVNGYVLQKQRIKEIFEKLCSMPAELRLHVPGMEKGREEVIIPGILITLELMDMLAMDELVVSDYGLREGLAVAVANI
jgi:exopolyphosphatase/guanosine-5'-triphosphate,3'-diphosphate pyrophosphatase